MYGQEDLPTYTREPGFPRRARRGLRPGKDDGGGVCSRAMNKIANFNGEPHSKSCPWALRRHSPIDLSTPRTRPDRGCPNPTQTGAQSVRVSLCWFVSVGIGVVLPLICMLQTGGTRARRGLRPGKDDGGGVCSRAMNKIANFNGEPHSKSCPWALRRHSPIDLSTPRTRPDRGCPVGSVSTRSSFLVPRVTKP